MPTVRNRLPPKGTMRSSVLSGERGSAKRGTSPWGHCGAPPAQHPNLSKGFLRTISNCWELFQIPSWRFRKEKKTPKPMTTKFGFSESQALGHRICCVSFHFLRLPLCLRPSCHCSRYSFKTQPAGLMTRLATQPTSTSSHRRKSLSPGHR